MYRLRSLIWKTYKVRFRSPLSTSVDVGGPLIAMILYLIIKLILSLTSSIDASTLASSDASSNITYIDINPKESLQRFICSKILFYTDLSSKQLIKNSISNRCGVELIESGSRKDLIDQLNNSINERIYYSKKDKNLNRNNKTTACNELQAGYQVGIVINSLKSIELHTTETVNIRVLNLPYVIGSSYNEFRLPHSDLNSGIHLLYLCLTDSLKANNYNYDANNKSNDSNSFNLRMASFPITADPIQMQLLFILVQMFGNLCNALVTIMRVSQDNENGIHQYIRLSGVSSLTYWTSQSIVIMIHMIIQSLISAILLAAPIGTEVLFDPIYEISLTLRWSLILSYSLTLNMHAQCIGNMFLRTSHAILITCLLGIGYGMFPMIYMLQWNPYGYSRYGPLPDLALYNPGSNYEALLLVIFAYNMHTTEPFTWSKLSWSIPGGGIVDHTAASMWILLLVQLVIWFLITVLYDQYYYSSGFSLTVFLMTFFNDVSLCLNFLDPRANSKAMIEESRSKSSNLQQIALLSNVAKDTKSKGFLNPNRLCCSLHQVSVTGPTIMVAHTRGDPLKMTYEQLKRLQQTTTTSSLDDDVAKSSNQLHQFIINRFTAKDTTSGSGKVQPVMLDEALKQHIVLYKTRIYFEDLDLEFRYNQVSFILGQTDYKQLFFDTLLALRSIKNGKIVLDNLEYNSNSLNYARPQLGFLGERDIFINELSVFENLQLFGSLRDRSYSQFDSESQFVLSLLHLSSRKDSLPVSLTNRSARKLALAVAAVGHTKLLLLVEPTLGLRWKPRCQVLNLLKKYKSIRSIIVDTSDVDEAVAFGDKIILFKNSQAYLNGTPQNLTRKLSCGHWIVFESHVDTKNGLQIKSDKSTMSMGNLGLIETLTNDIFKEDKLEKLDINHRSVYEELMKSTIKESASKSAKEEANKIARTFDNEKLSRNIMILKIQHSPKSNDSICSLLKMIQSQPKSFHGFRLAGLTYESLEDVLVMNMARAFYPDLPPDLLLSLQHRTQAHKSYNSDRPQVSVRRSDLDEDQKGLKIVRPIFNSTIRQIIKDRLTTSHEIYIYLIALTIALVWFSLALVALQYSVAQGSDHLDTITDKQQLVELQQEQSDNTMKFSSIGEFYRQRIGVFIQRNISSRYIKASAVDRKLIGSIDGNSPESVEIAKLIQKNLNLVVAFIIYNPDKGQATILFEPHHPRAMIASIDTLINLNHKFNSNKKSERISSSSSNNGYTNFEFKQHDYDSLIRSYQEVSSKSDTINVSQYQVKQAWYGILKGFQARRLFYGLGFAFSEGISIGILILAPSRHGSESSFSKVEFTYWLAMLIFDLTLSFLQVICYNLAIVLIDGTNQTGLMLANVLILILFKLVMIPTAYLVSLVATSKLNGFTFVLILNTVMAHAFAITMRTFIEWLLLSEGYLYTISKWIILCIPINSLVDSLSIINHISKIDHLCSQVPAYTATKNLVELDGPQRINVVDLLMAKVRECLKNGKQGIETDVFHSSKFGILYQIYLLLMFGFIIWSFLILSDRLFGILSKRFSTARSSSDPLKNIIRSTETKSLFKWDRERERLISEYIRSMNEPKYVKTMTNNCIYVRIWLKPMSDQSSVDKRLSMLLEPLAFLGQPKNDVQIELKTTLQIFIRIGSESNRHKLDRIQLLEIYSKFVKEHSDAVMKFALLDWTRETLYKILLHGHYNTKSSTAIT